MAASPPQSVINRKKRSLEKKYGKPSVVLRASNGEVAIVSREYLESCRAAR